jgi:hypothetical protein
MKLIRLVKGHFISSALTFALKLTAEVYSDVPLPFPNYSSLTLSARYHANVFMPDNTSTVPAPSPLVQVSVPTGA